MDNRLPQTGTVELLHRLSPFIPDSLVNQLCPRKSRGRRPKYSAAQLFRLLLLPLVTPVRSFNLTVKLLKEHQGWRRFARLRNRHDIPDASLLHDFRSRLGLDDLRQINTHLLKPLLSPSNLRTTTVALIDSTDLPAATGNNYKKNMIGAIRPNAPPRDFGRAKVVRANGLSDTKSTPCDFGSMAAVWKAN